ncbi:hypothetical protein GCM10027098_08120 [Bowmanella dokdonensis]
MISDKPPAHLSLVKETSQAIQCAKDSYLFNQTGLNLYCYRLLHGKAEIQLWVQDVKVRVGELGMGEWVGQIPSETTEPYRFAVQCLEPCRFEKIAWAEIPAQEAESLSFRQQFELMLKRMHAVELLVKTFRRSYPNVSVEFLDDLIASAEFEHLEENQTLFEQGDNAQVMYFLLSGKIDVYAGEAESLSRVGEIFHGEPFGEMSLFSNQARSTKLVATRTCDLIGLDRTHFDRLSVKYPWLSTYIVSSLVSRIKKQSARTRDQAKPVNRLVMICDPLAEEHADKLQKELFATEDSFVTETMVSQRFGKEVFSELPHTRLINFLDSLEQQFGTNIYFSDDSLSPWTKFCLERSDEVWLMVNASGSPADLLHKLDYFRPMFSWQKQTLKLVLIQHDLDRIQHTAGWLTAFCPEQHFHLQQDSARSMKRLGRYLTNKALGLVLGGGGARGFAQVGILQAFEEAGIEVDWVGGTSMGSIIGGWIAMGWESRRIREAVRRFFVSVNPLGDYTLPMISLSRSQRLDNLLHEGFGDVRIEDLPLPFFCVSSDMSIAEERDHFSGPLWRSARASVSIPGVIAPVIDEGHYLVDGALFNNLPCDLMRQRNEGPIVAIDVTPDEEYLTQLQQVPSPWQLLMNKLFGRPQPKVPSILHTLLRSSLLASTQRQRTNREIVDYFIQPHIHNVGMLDFKQADRIIEAGYQEGLAYVQQAMTALIDGGSPGVAAKRRTDSEDG